MGKRLKCICGREYMCQGDGTMYLAAPVNAASGPSCNRCKIPASSKGFCPSWPRNCACPLWHRNIQQPMVSASGLQSLSNEKTGKDWGKRVVQS